MAPGIYNVLFLCTGNSARSIMAEVLLNHLGKGKIRAYSAGSHPTGAVNPHALELLRSLALPTAGARSKSWDELAAQGAPVMDFVFTVCSQAAGEACRGCMLCPPSPSSGMVRGSGKEARRTVWSARYVGLERTSRMGIRRARSAFPMARAVARPFSSSCRSSAVFSRSADALSGGMAGALAWRITRT